MIKSFIVMINHIIVGIKCIIIDDNVHYRGDNLDLLGNKGDHSAEIVSNPDE